MLLVLHFVFKCFEKLLSKTFFSIFQPLKLGMATGQVRARFCIPEPNLRPRPNSFTKRIFFSEARTHPHRAPRALLSPTKKEAFSKQALNSTSNPRPNNQSQKSLLFKSPQQHPNIKKRNNNKNPIFNP